MKFKILAIMLSAVTLFSCQKNENEPVVTQQEVTFSATLVKPEGPMKSTEDFFPCKNLSVDYAMIVLDNDYYFVDVFTIGGTLYTQAIKLTVPAGPPKTFTVSQFYLMHIKNGKDPIPTGTWNGDDEIIWATPTETSEYRIYVSDPVDVTFTLDPFTKVEVPIDVLCFQDLVYQQFGFFWFDITEIIIREQCFFGDFCIKHAEEYDGSSYENQSGYPGTGYYDAPAIVEIEVLKKDPVTGLWNAVYGSPFNNNASPWGVGAPVCIEYPDVVNQVDSFKVNLKILVKVGAGFQFVTFKTWKFADGYMIVPPAPAGDGIVDFVLGSCNLTPTDVQLPPYINLPAQCNLYVSGNYYFNNQSGGAMDGRISGISPDAYDLKNTVIPAWEQIWCFDRTVTIYVPFNSLMNVYNSLFPATMPAYLAVNPWARGNWIMNHLGNWPGYNWMDLQGAFWLLEGWDGSGEPFGITTKAQQMHDAAVAALPNPSDPYYPLPGGWAAVAFAKPDGSIVQTIFMKVDP